MAELILQLGRHFPEAELVAVRQKKRVVAKSALAAFRIQNPAFNRAIGDLKHRVVAGQNEHATKPPGAILRVAEFTNQLRAVVGIGRALARVTRRVNPRRFAERVDLKARIVRQHGHARQLRARVPRLDLRVRLEGVAVLDRGRDFRVGRQIDDFVKARTENLANLFGLVELWVATTRRLMAGHSLARKRCPGKRRTSIDFESTTSSAILLHFRAGSATVFGMPTSTEPTSSRRDFAKRSLQSLLTISVIEHLCSGNLLAADFKPTAVEWLNELNQVGLDMKGQKMPEIDWHARVEDLLKNQIELAELLRFIDFEAIEKSAKIRDNGAHSLRFKFPDVDGVPEKLVFGQQIFALGKGRSVVPHGHNNMATAFLILKGNCTGRLYDRLEDQKDHLIIKPTIDERFGPGSSSSITDVKDNIHWFKAEDEPAFIFNIHVLGFKPDFPKRTGRVYLDPNGEKLDDGLIRARRIESEEAHKLYG